VTMKTSRPGLTLFVFIFFLFICTGLYAQSSDKSSDKSADKNFFDEYITNTLHIESYEPVYFLPFLMDFTEHDDRDPIEVTFQVSFKKNIVQDITPLGFDMGIAFTQTIWWQLYTFSNPIRETVYAPEFYFYFPFHRESGEDGLFCHGIKLAVAHKSNGQTGDNNRSWNRIFLDAPISIKSFMFIPRIWWSFKGIGNDSTEIDIPRYMGMCDLTVISHWKKHVLRLYGRTNFNFKNIKSALQVDYSYPISTAGFYLYIKYFLGYGESLLDYYRTVNKIGAGLSLSR